MAKIEDASVTDRKLSTYNAKGEEIPDPKPGSLPIGFERPRPLAETIRSLVRSDLLAAFARDNGAETFDEADDFDIPEDDTFDRATPYEDRFEPEVPGVVAREQEIRSGFVEDIPLERKEKAREVIRRVKGYSEKRVVGKRTEEADRDPEEGIEDDDVSGSLDAERDRRSAKRAKAARRA